MVSARKPEDSRPRTMPLWRNSLGVVATLDDTSSLAAQSAQVVQLGATHAATTHDLDGVDCRGVQRELLPSLIFTFTSTVSPARNSGISSAGFRCLASNASIALTIAIPRSLPHISALVGAYAACFTHVPFGAYACGSPQVCLSEGANPPTRWPFDPSAGPKRKAGLCGVPPFGTSAVKNTPSARPI